MAGDAKQLVGNNVRRQRIAVGITQAELANRMEVDRAYVSGLERGQRNITVVGLSKTAIALGVTMAELVAEELGMPPLSTQRPARKKP